MKCAWLTDWRGLVGSWRRLRSDARGVAAVEFALIVPIVIVVYAGGFEIAQAATVYRKLTDTTVQLANVTSQYTSVAKSDISNIMGASAQIMAPYSTSPLASVLTEVKTNNAGVASVVWSEPYPVGGPYLPCGTVAMPAGFASPNSYYILVQTTYGYTPTIGAAFVNDIPMSNQIFMVPRESPSIPCTDCVICP
jgi:Flp pilus assembly protein TadG